MLAEETSRLVSDLLQAWNSHDVARAAALYAPEYEGVDVGSVAPYRGPSGAARSMRSYLQAFPDLRLTRDEVVVQGELVALFWTARGTHKGTLMRIPPTDRKVTVRGVSLLTVSAGKITHGLYLWDVAGLLRDVGLLPELPEPPETVEG